MTGAFWPVWGWPAAVAIGFAHAAPLVRERLGQEPAPEA